MDSGVVRWVYRDLGPIEEGEERTGCAVDLIRRVDGADQRNDDERPLARKYREE